MDRSKKLRLIIVSVLAAFLAVCLIIVAVYHQMTAPFRGLPPVAFNFPLSKKEWRLGDYSDSSHIYEYDFATKRVTPHFIDGLEWLDADMTAKLVLGRMEEAIVELDLTDDFIRELGPATYQGQPLEFVRRRPGTEDYCGITKNGKLVLWNQADREFVLLKTLDWNGYSFGCSWSGDGKRLYVPDETGIGIIDIDTLEETHWLTLPIHYPTENHGGHGSYKNVFAVSPDQNTVIYCAAGKRLLLARISGDGYIINEMELGQFEDDCAFSTLDNNTIIFVLTKDRPFLFSHSAYEILLYRDDALHKIAKTDWANNICSGTYVFW